MDDRVFFPLAKQSFFDSLHSAVYGVVLAAYRQGLELIVRAIIDEG